MRQKKVLEKILWKFQYRFRCGTSDCVKEHRALFEDWEVGETWRKWRSAYNDALLLKEKLIERFVSIPQKNDNLYLVLGTPSAPYLNTWLTIGALQPSLVQRSDTPQLSFAPM